MPADATYEPRIVDYGAEEDKHSRYEIASGGDSACREEMRATPFCSEHSLEIIDDKLGDLIAGERSQKAPKMVILKLGVDEYEEVYPELCTRPWHNCLQCAIEGKFQCQYIVEQRELWERQQDADELVGMLNSDW